MQRQMLLTPRMKPGEDCSPERLANDSRGSWEVAPATFDARFISPVEQEIASIFTISRRLDR